MASINGLLDAVTGRSNPLLSLLTSSNGSGQTQLSPNTILDLLLSEIQSTRQLSGGDNSDVLGRGILGLGSSNSPSVRAIQRQVLGGSLGAIFGPSTSSNFQERAQTGLARLAGFAGLI